MVKNALPNFASKVNGSQRETTSSRMAEGGAVTGEESVLAESLMHTQTLKSTTRDIEIQNEIARKSIESKQTLGIIAEAQTM